uniref:EF-hand domain-containing protein n=1 Tax=Strombidium rassoulzadegani TaxID=1082188 RepID=A0A7S3CLU5_9SPIT|mmetsp:Transcript_15715/g.26499  ORF Transcript_15715/g.26499 Transcript_15715/m.26499 type:complete len:119 (+) Transcript_15715:236-592(+)
MTPNGVEYLRTLPDQFNEDSPNKFMLNILTNYSLEQKSAKGEPSGIFKMDKKQTLAASREVLEKHKHLTGKDQDEYIKQYFGRTWEHFDVNKDGMLDSLDMPAFMKFLASDQSIDLDS